MGWTAMTTEPIRNENEYDCALVEIEHLWGAAEGTAEGNRLDSLVAQVESYEQIHFPIDAPDPVQAIQFRQEQQ